jgi:hypothetical protein
MVGLLAAMMAMLTLGQPSIPSRNAKSAALRLSETCVFGGADGGEGAAGCCDAGGEVGGAAQEASARAASVGSRKPAGRIGRGREWGSFIGAILYEPAPPRSLGHGYREGTGNGKGASGGAAARGAAGGRDGGGL